MTQSLPAYKILCLLATGHFCLATGCKQSEESKIKEVAKQYIEGRIKLRRGDSLQLKSVTDASLFRFMVLTEEYIKIINTTTISADLTSFQPGVVKIEGQKASCEMSGDDFYVLELIKTGDSWKVNGENQQYMSQEKITELRKKIADYTLFQQDKPARDSVLKVINLFFAGVRTFAKDGNISAIDSIATPETRKLIERFYEYAKQRSGADVLLEEIEQPNSVVGDVIFDGNEVEFKLYNEPTRVHLIKQNEEYKVSGFENKESSQINSQSMKDNYLGLLRAMKLIRKSEFRSPDIK